ncbi:MAG TPA: SRPBCC domain-containing protein, partial [Polyangiaceae bacterium]|nr:SRPBCC domain-containing protein [Polyangiaceae bacterium]
ASDAWDDQVESFESGWPRFFAVLRAYLTYFPGQAAAVLRIAGPSAADQVTTWSRLTSALNLAGAGAGERRAAPEGAPGLAGVVERVQQDLTSREILLKLEQPGPGIAVLGTFAFQGKTQASLSVYLYGERAQELAEKHRAPWTKWFEGLVAKA